MKEKLTGENGELIFADEFPMENMYYILYYNFIDASKKHFMWRQMPLFALFDEHTSEEIACFCLSLIKSVAKKEDKTGLEFLDSYEFPKEVQSAVEKLREAFQDDMAVTRAMGAFELLDWLSACECGGVKSKPNIQSVTSRRDGGKVLVDVAYSYDSEIHPYSDVWYHSGYDPEDIFHDIFEVTEKRIRITAAHENRHLVGCEDIFKDYRNNPDYEGYITEYEGGIYHEKAHSHPARSDHDPFPGFLRCSRRH